MKRMWQSIFCISLAVVFTLACHGCAAAQPGGQQGDGIWLRNAYYGEFQTFDKCYGHQPGNGQYHHHVQPVCLRAQLEDNLVAVSSGRTGTVYREKSAPWKHSPILGWAFDGYPIYGPYGYSDPQNPNSAVKRVKSGFRLRSIAQRNTLAEWSLAHHTGVSQQLSAAQSGPDVSDFFPLGRYVEDYEYAQGSGDLDVYNGRFAVTPEFPNGVYAYYVTIDDDGAPAFPYIVGLQYYGSVTGNNNTAAPGATQPYFAAGAYTQNLASAPLLNSWFTKNSQQPAQIVSGFDPSAGPQSTWPTNAPAGAMASGGAAAPVKADTQSISYTDSSVYVAANNLGSYVMGPWFIDGGNGGVFMNFPSAQNNRAQIPRNPTAAATKRNTGLGAIGLWVNGVAVFNVLDGSSYSNAARNDLGGGGVRPSSVHVSSASFEGGPVAPGSLVAAFALFGAKLATATATADSNNWPASLGGASVSVRDSAGNTYPAAISYASPNQVNYRAPEGMAAGLASVTITAAGVSIPGAINVVAAYPNLFQLNNEGLAAAYLLRVRAGKQTIEPIHQSSANTLIAAPIDLGPDSDETYLILFGSGLGKSNPQAAASIGGIAVTPSYAGPQEFFPGLDQFNLPIPRTLSGKGKVDVTVTVGGRTSNRVNITVK
jgi:uncharacterized protein (TIGR03437 family)